jgi:hypothetical protein
MMLGANDHADRYTLEGQLECSEGFRVYFRQVGYSQTRVKNIGIPAGRGIADLTGTVRLEPRGTWWQSKPQPTTFLALCQQLLLEGTSRTNRYKFGADLILEANGRPLPVDIESIHHPRSFVEFAHTEGEPFVLIRHRAQDSYPGRDELETACKERWPTLLTE